MPPFRRLRLYGGPLFCSGFDSGRLSFFSLLGVTYYLTAEENTRIFDTIAKIAPKGSAVVFDYADEHFFDVKKKPRRAKCARPKECGEPMKCGFSYEALEAALEKAGLLIYEHLLPADIEQRFFTNRTDDYHAFENTCYALAVVQ